MPNICTSCLSLGLRTDLRGILVCSLDWWFRGLLFICRVFFALWEPGLRGPISFGGRSFFPVGENFDHCYL